jgi:hypothetical protein
MFEHPARVKRCDDHFHLGVDVKSNQKMLRFEKSGAFEPYFIF